jgi:flagellar assembly protein FliH
VEKNTFKLMSGTDSAACVPWLAPEVGVAALKEASEPVAVPPTAARIEEIQRQAYEEAFALGRRDGLEQGKRQARAQAERLEAVLRQLGEPLRELDERVVDELVELALAIARHLVRRELRADPGQIVAVVQQAAAALPFAARKVRVVLHPEDAATVREALSASGGVEHGDGWEIVEDPAMMRGGCRVETEHSRIDASVEKRLAAIAADLLGGERARDDDGAE